MSTRTQYEADLAALKGSLAKMSQLSADAVENALEALCTADAEEAKGIIKGDTEVNRMERDIEHRCMTLLLRQQPVAGDLRFISAAMKVVTDVERIGDHAADIAEIVPHLAGVRKAGDPAVSRSIEMGRKAHKMLQDAMSAFAAEDEAAAKAVIDADDAVDYDFNSIKRMLAAEIASDPGKVDAALDVLGLAVALEASSLSAPFVPLPSVWSSAAVLPSVLSPAFALASPLGCPSFAVPVCPSLGLPSPPSLPDGVLGAFSSSTVAPGAAAAAVRAAPASP